MFNPSKYILTNCFIILLVNLVFVSPAVSKDRYVIDPVQSNIQCLVRYAVVGKYNAVFEDFEGEIHFNTENLKESSVELSINTKSLQSAYPKPFI